MTFHSSGVRSAGVFRDSLYCVCNFLSEFKGTPCSEPQGADIEEVCKAKHEVPFPDALHSHALHAEASCVAFASLFSF